MRKRRIIQPVQLIPVPMHRHLQSNAFAALLGSDRGSASCHSERGRSPRRGIFLIPSPTDRQLCNALHIDLADWLLKYLEGKNA